MLKLCRLLRRLRGDQSGVAAVEFALWTVGFFFAVMVALDFGTYFIKRGQMNEAVGAAAIASFKTADNVDFAHLPTYVRAVTGSANMSVATACNGSAGSCTNLNRTCACLKTDGSYVAASCGSICTGPGVTAGSTAGYYLTIDASDSFTPMVVPQGALADATVAQQATVRLQ